MSVYVPGKLEKDPKKIIQSLHEFSQGRSNAVGTVTLAASVTSTTVTDPNCAAGTTPSLTPMTANAAAAQATTYIPAATIVNGSFVIQHANNAQTDRTFRYSFVG